MRNKSGNKAANPVAAAARVLERKPEPKRLLAIVIALLLVLGGLLAYVAAIRTTSLYPASRHCRRLRSTPKKRPTPPA